MLIPPLCPLHGFAWRVIIFLVQLLEIEIHTLIFKSGWVGFFWTVWVVTKKSAGFAKHSLGMTGSAIAAYKSAGHARRHHDSGNISDWVACRQERNFSYVENVFMLWMLAFTCLCYALIPVAMLLLYIDLLFDADTSRSLKHNSLVWSANIMSILSAE